MLELCSSVNFYFLSIPLQLTHELESHWLPTGPPQRTPVKTSPTLCLLQLTPLGLDFPGNVPADTSEIFQLMQRNPKESKVSSYMKENSGYATYAER